MTNRCSPFFNTAVVAKVSYAKSNNFTEESAHLPPPSFLASQIRGGNAEGVALGGGTRCRGKKSFIQSTTRLGCRRVRSSCAHLLSLFRSGE